MRKGFDSSIREFVREVYSYCDKNAGEETLFPAFLNQWHENGNEKDYIAKQELALITSKLVSQLIDKGVLEVIHSADRPNDSYGFYKILNHTNLMNYTYREENKMKSLKM